MKPGEKNAHKAGRELAHSILRQLRDLTDESLGDLANQIAVRHPRSRLRNWTERDLSARRSTASTRNPMNRPAFMSAAHLYPPDSSMAQKSRICPQARLSLTSPVVVRTVLPSGCVLLSMPSPDKMKSRFTAKRSTRKLEAHGI